MPALRAKARAFAEQYDADLVLRTGLDSRPSSARGGPAVTPPDLMAEYRRRCDTDSDIREYLPLLHGYARLYPGVKVLEVGVRSGNSTVAFLAAALFAGGHVWSVDIEDVRDRAQGDQPVAGSPGVDVHLR